MKKPFYAVVVPNWALPALINDDFSGLEDDEISKIEAFLAGLRGCIVGPGDEVGFRHTNAIDSLGADCTEVFIDEKLEA